ncbi:MAG: hypothetical protein NTZ11_18295 [Gammaproteobacteria bacterium]|nr:hypothetical protein [Gammaproteobacteria bacterium]
MKLDLPLDAFELDEKNPRIRGAGNQTEALNQLLEVEGDTIFGLARDISVRKRLDPTERLSVIAHPTTPGRYIALDGNRRLSALRLLKKNGLVDRADINLTPTQRKLMKQYAKRVDDSVAAVIEAFCFPSRDEANEFIRLKHTGANNGAGRIAWLAVPQGRFEQSGSWKTLSKLRELSRLAPAVVAELDAGTFALTTFERVAQSERFTELFKFNVSQCKALPQANVDLAYDALARIAAGVSNKEITSRGEFETVAKIGQFLDQLRAGIQLPSSQGGAGYKGQKKAEGEDEHPKRASGKDSDGANDVAKHEASPAATRFEEETPPTTVEDVPKKPRIRKGTGKLVRRDDFQFVTNAKCNAILKDLRAISVFDAPYACSALARSLLELTCLHYGREFGVTGKGYEQTIKAAANHLKSGEFNITNDPVNRLDIAISLDTAAARYEEFSNYMHNSVSLASPEAAASAFESIKPGLELMWQRMHFNAAKKGKMTLAEGKKSR